MGNHEFCTDCGASDFHMNEPCDPVRKAQYQRQREKAHKAYEEIQQAKVEIEKIGYVRVLKFLNRCRRKDTPLLP